MSKLPRPPAVPPPIPKRGTKASKGTSGVLLVVLCAVIVTAIVVKRRGGDADRPAVAPPEVSNVAADRDRPSPPDSRTPTINSRKPVVDEQIEVAEDGYSASIVDLKRDAIVEVSIDVLAGPDVETWVLDSDGFQQFERAGKAFFGGRFTHFPELRMTNARKERRSSRLAAGRYYFVVDNTDEGETKPPANLQDDTATLRITISAR